MRTACQPYPPCAPCMPYVACGPSAYIIPGQLVAAAVRQQLQRRCWLVLCACCPHGHTCSPCHCHASISSSTPPWWQLYPTSQPSHTCRVRASLSHHPCHLHPASAYQTGCTYPAWSCWRCAPWTLPQRPPWTRPACSHCAQRLRRLQANPPHSSHSLWAASRTSTGTWPTPAVCCGRPGT